ncbi:putative ATPase subunit gpP of terminase [Anaerobacterium chartisolvens]|uniref:Putative ATPase subunit gpP of terminase n=2 Tax=Anaerobacterium chartisolvens TaxID=1297424 RepID=A0A369B7C4_9FIRM|nr:putative ATPase subunit gpP of terminase [Anaerobacterium chartisolvens]
MAVLYHLKGYLNKDIAEMLELCQHRVETYVTRYKASGIDVLALGHSPGAPHILTDEQ